MNRSIGRILAAAGGLLAVTTGALGQVTVTAPSRGNLEVIGPNSRIVLAYAGVANSAAVTFGGQVFTIDSNGDVVNVGTSIALAPGVDANQDGTPGDAETSSGAGAGDIDVFVASVTGLVSALNSAAATIGSDDGSGDTIVAVGLQISATATATVTSANPTSSSLNGPFNVGAESPRFDGSATTITNIISETASGNTTVRFAFSKPLQSDVAAAGDLDVANVSAAADIEYDDAAGFGTPQFLTSAVAGTVTVPNPNVLQVVVANADLQATTPFVVGNFARFATAGAGVVDYLGNELEAGSTPPVAGIASTALPALTITGVQLREKANESILRGVSVDRAVRVTFNLPIDSGDLGNAAFYGTNLQVASAASDLTLGGIEADPTDPRSVFLDITGGSDTINANARDDDQNAYAISTATTGGANVPSSQLAANDYTNAQANIAAADAIRPTLVLRSFHDLNNDGDQDAVALVYDEPLSATLPAAARVTVTAVAGNTTPWRQITADGALTTVASTLTGSVPFTLSRAGVTTNSGVTALETNNAIVASFDPLSLDFDGDGDAAAAPGAETAATEAIPSTGNSGLFQLAFATGSGAGITDTVGNEAAPAANATVTSDRASPFLTAARFYAGDNNPNTTNNLQAITETDGTVGDRGGPNGEDRAELVFSENIANTIGSIDETKFRFGPNATSTFGNSDGLFRTNNIVTFINFGLDNDLAPGTNISIIAGNNADDAEGNEPVSNGVVLTDRRAPYVLLQGDSAIDSAFLFDADNDTFADQILVTLSQPVVGTTVQGGDFTVTNPSGTVASAAVSTSNSRVIEINLTDGVISMSNTPTVTYASGGTDTTPIATVGTNAAVSIFGGGNSQFIARQVPSEPGAAQPAIMEVTGIGTENGVPLAIGSTIHAFPTIPVVCEINFIVNGERICINREYDGRYDTSDLFPSLTAVNRWLFGFEKDIFAVRSFNGRWLITNRPVSGNGSIDIDDDDKLDDFGDDEFEPEFFIRLTTTGATGSSFTGLGFTGTGQIPSSTSSSSGSLSGGTRINITGGRFEFCWDVIRAQSGSLTEFYRNGYAFDGEPVGSSAVFGATNGRFELRVAAPIAAFDGMARLNSIGRPVILVLTRTDGTRAALSSLLTSARNNATPILFDPINRTQTAASPLPGSLAPNATDFTFDTNNIQTQRHWEGWNSLSNTRNSGVANLANRPITMQGVNAANIQPLNLQFAGPLDQVVFWIEDGGDDETWTDDDDDNGDFSSIVIDTAMADLFAFTMTSFGAQFGNAINNFVGGYAAGVFCHQELGSFIFGQPLTGTTLFAAGTAPAGFFPNNTTTQGWGFFSSKANYAGGSTTTLATSLATPNPRLDFILKWRNTEDGFEVSSLDVLNPAANSTTDLNDALELMSHNTFFGHFRPQ